MKSIITPRSSTQAGQVLLATLMILAVVITVVFTAVFTARTSTQTTKLEQESQRALAAAEAGVQAALQKGGDINFGQESLADFDDYTGGVTVSTDTTDNAFTAPAMEQDEMYTFYMGAYAPGTPPTIAPSANESLTICFGSGSSTPALDIALIKDGASTNRVLRYAVDPNGRISNASPGTTGCAENGNFTHSYTIPAADISTNTKLLAVRILYTQGKLFFHRQTTPLPAQGFTVESTATTSDTNITKKVRVFESYPQLLPEAFSFTY